MKFCFKPVLRAELQRVAQHWNLHKIRPSKNEDSPAERPDVLYFIPEADDRASYLNEVPEEEVQVAMDVCCEEPEDDVSDSFRELASILMNKTILGCPQMLLKQRIFTVNFSVLLTTFKYHTITTSIFWFA